MAMAVQTILENLSLQGVDLEIYQISFFPQQIYIYEVKWRIVENNSFVCEDSS